VTSIFGFLVVCVAIGMLTREVRASTRLLLLAVVVLLVVYATLTIPSTLVLK